MEGYEIFTHKDKFHFKHGVYFQPIILCSAAESHMKSHGTLHAQCKELIHLYYYAQYTGLLHIGILYIHFLPGGYIPRLDLAYETWGELNDQRSNAILLFTGISASSHACSTQVFYTNTKNLIP